MANTFTEGLDPRELAWVTAAALPVERTTAAGRGPPATATATAAFGGDGGEARAAGRQEGYSNTHVANGTRRTEDTTVRGHQANHAVDAHHIRRYAYYGGDEWEKGGDAHGPAVVVTSPAHGHGQGAARANGRSLAPTAPPMRSTDGGTSDVGDANTYYDARSAFHDGPVTGRHSAAAAAGAGSSGVGPSPEPPGPSWRREDQVPVHPVREQIHFYNNVSSRQAGTGAFSRVNSVSSNGQYSAGAGVVTPSSMSTGGYHDDSHAAASSGRRPPSSGGADDGAYTQNHHHAAGHTEKQQQQQQHVVLRGDPWSAVVTYDASLMLCLSAAGRRHTSGPSTAAAEFLQDGCRSLRRAFALQDKLVTMPGEDLGSVPKEGAWEDSSEDEINAAVSLGGNGQRYLRKLIVEIDSEGVPSSAFAGGEGGASASSAAQGAPGGGWVPAKMLRMIKVCLPKKDVPDAKECSVTWKGQGNRQFSVDGKLDDQLELSLPPAETDATAGVGGNAASVASGAPARSGETEEICVAVGMLRGTMPMPAEIPYVTDKSHCVVMEPGGVRVQVHVSVVAVQQSSQFGQLGQHETQAISRRVVTASRVSTARAYDVLLRVALRDVGFRPRRLHLSGKWAWLVAEFAAVHGVSGAHQRLALLYHLLGASTPTKDCIDAVTAEMKPMLQLRDSSQLSAQENVQLTAITARVEALLATVLENFKSLDDSRPSGYLDVPTSVRPDTCLPALGAAVALHTTVHDPLLPDSQKLLRDRLQSAAKRRYRQVSRDVEQKQRRRDDDGAVDAGMTADVLNFEHDAVAELACRLRTELEADGHIASRRVLPLSIDIEALMGRQYAALFRDRLAHSLRQYPPRRPTASAVNVINCVADLEQDVHARCAGGAGGPGGPGGHAIPPSFMNSSSPYGDEPAELSGLFMDFIDDWISDLQTEVESFCSRVRVPRSGYEHAAGAGDHAGISPASPRRCAQHTEDVETVLTALTERLAPFETIINRWNDFSISLEDAIASVVRVLVEKLEEQVYPSGTGLSSGNGGAAAGSFGGRAAAVGIPSVDAPSTSSSSAASLMRKFKSVASRGRDGGKAATASRDTSSASNSQARPQTTSSQHNLSPRKILARRSMGSTKYCVGAAHAYVLNALKRIMMTLPSLEMQVRDWIGDVPRLNGRGKFGVRFAVVMGELQTQYATLLGAVVSRVAEDVFLSKHTSLRLSLQAMFSNADVSSGGQHGRRANVLRSNGSSRRLSGGGSAGAASAGGENAQDVIVPEDDVERMLQPTKGLLNDVIHKADEVLLPRVFVSFCRGLWDATGRDMQLYLEDLSEMRENKSWLQRCAAAAAMESMDEFFRSAMQERHELHEKDLQDPPESVRKCHQQLVRYMGAGPAANGNNLYTSFSVF